MSNFNGINCDICGLSVDRDRYNISNWVIYCREKSVKDAVSVNPSKPLQAFAFHMCEKCFDAAEAAAVDKFGSRPEKV